jgi:hypothetical protein
MPVDLAIHLGQFPLPPSASSSSTATSYYTTSDYISTRSETFHDFDFHFRLVIRVDSGGKLNDNDISRLYMTEDKSARIGREKYNG